MHHANWWWVYDCIISIRRKSGCWENKLHWHILCIRIFPLSTGHWPKTKKTFHIRRIKKMYSECNDLCTTPASRHQFTQDQICSTWAPAFCNIYVWESAILLVLWTQRVVNYMHFKAPHRETLINQQRISMNNQKHKPSPQSTVE